MKRSWLLLLFAVTFLALPSCKDDDENDTPEKPVITDDGSSNTYKPWTYVKEQKEFLEYTYEGNDKIVFGPSIIFEYDSRWRLIYSRSETNRLAANTTVTTDGYLYNNNEVTYYENHSGKMIRNSYFIRTIYLDNNRQKVKSNIIYNYDDRNKEIKEISREEYQYDGIGRQIGYTYAYRGIVFRDYSYNDNELIYYYDQYDTSTGMLKSTQKRKEIYSDNKKIEIKYIANDDTKEDIRSEYEYDELGRVIARNDYHNGVLWSNYDYTYDEDKKTLTVIESILSISQAITRYVYVYY